MSQPVFPSQDQQLRGDSRGSSRPIMAQLTDNKTYTLSELTTYKPVPPPHTVFNQTITNGNSMTFVNVSGQPQHFVVMKGIYPVGEELNARPQAEYKLDNGQVAYQKTHGCYNFVVNWTERGHSNNFDKQSAVNDVREYTAFNVTIDENGDIVIVGTTFDSQQKGILYWFIDESAPELSDWSIEVYYNEEYLKTLKPCNEKELYVDDNDNTLRPTAYYRMADEYTVYVLQQSDTKANMKPRTQKRYEVSVGPKFIVPGQAMAFCKSSSVQGATTINTLGIVEITDPSTVKVPISGGSRGDPGY